VIYTPLYYLLSHFSKFIRPGSKRIGLKGEQVEGIARTAAKNEDGSIAVVVFNGNEEQHEISLSLSGSTYSINIAPRSIQTIHLKSRQDNKE